MVLFAHMTLLRYLGSGPGWPGIVSYMETNCYNYWWSVLLYVQNFVNPNNVCIGQTWYLAVDMQLFLISPLILYPLRKWPTKTLVALCIIVILGIVSPAIIAYQYELKALIPLME